MLETFIFWYLASVGVTAFIEIGSEARKKTKPIKESKILVREDYDKCIKKVLSKSSKIQEFISSIPPLFPFLNIIGAISHGIEKSKAIELSRAFWIPLDEEDNQKLNSEKFKLKKFILIDKLNEKYLRAKELTKYDLANGMDPSLSPIDDEIENAIVRNGVFPSLIKMNMLDEIADVTNNKGFVLGKITGDSNINNPICIVGTPKKYFVSSQVEYECDNKMNSFHRMNKDEFDENTKFVLIPYDSRELTIIGQKISNVLTGHAKQKESDKDYSQNVICEGKPTKPVILAKELKK